MKERRMKHVQHYRLDRTPKDNPHRAHDADCAPFTAENCTGYSADEIRTLNTEFTERWNGGEWAGSDYLEAMNAFQDEVSRRERSGASLTRWRNPWPQGATMERERIDNVSIMMHPADNGFCVSFVQEQQARTCAAEAKRAGAFAVCVWTA
jgi:hypothetical protein